MRREAKFQTVNCIAASLSSLHSCQSMFPAIITTAFIVFRQVLTFEYDQVFADILICGTDTPAFPFCAAPDESPIDIITSELESGRAIQCNRQGLNWRYNPPPDDEFEIVKEEHTLTVQAQNNAMFDNPVVPLTSRNTVQKFCLGQLHFHWGLTTNNGSEHALNGKYDPISLHFVHFNCKRKNIAKVQAAYPDEDALLLAKAQGIDVHELAVIDLHFELSEDANPALDRILDGNTIIEQQERDKCVVIPDQPRCEDPDPDPSPNPDAIFHSFVKGIDLTELLTDKILNGGYWTYEGSLTTPPCTPDGI